MRLNSQQLYEARVARRRGKRHRDRMRAGRKWKGNPYLYSEERHKHVAWAQGFTRAGTHA